jgi:hypothetical protein
MLDVASAMGACGLGARGARRGGDSQERGGGAAGGFAAAPLDGGAEGRFAGALVALVVLERFEDAFEGGDGAAAGECGVRGVALGGRFAECGEVGEGGGMTAQVMTSERERPA